MCYAYGTGKLSDWEGNWEVFRKNEKSTSVIVVTFLNYVDSIDDSLTERSFGQHHKIMANKQKLKIQQTKECISIF